MSDKDAYKKTKHPELKELVADASKNNRRRLVKCAVAVPIVMTLHSGVALAARSSNSVPAEKILDDAVKIGDQLLCVHPDTQMTQLSGADRIDVGDPPIASLGTSGEPLEKQEKKCHKVGGIMISGTSYSSIQDKLVINITTL